MNSKSILRVGVAAAVLLAVHTRGHCGEAVVVPLPVYQLPVYQSAPAVVQQVPPQIIYQQAPPIIVQQQPPVPQPPGDVVPAPPDLGPGCIPIVGELLKRIIQNRILIRNYRGRGHIPNGSNGTWVYYGY